MTPRVPRVRRRSRWQHCCSQPAAPGQVTPELRETIEARATPGDTAVAGGSLHDQGLLPRLRALGGSALHAVQHTVAHRRDVGRQLRRRVGRLRIRAFGRELKSPYPYKTAEEHYNALLAEARANGGPTIYDREHPPPDWDGYYNSRTLQQQQWSFGNNVQAATLMQVLTPEYQRRFVQALYHVAVSNSAQWVSSTCYPEGIMRWWAQGIRNIQVTVTPHQVQLLSGTALNFLRQILIGQKHVSLISQWYGETVGFWNGETLVAWTDHVQGWSMSHALPEFSSELEAIEVFTRDADRNIHLEITLYDPLAFVAPLRLEAIYTYLEGPDVRDALSVEGVSAGSLERQWSTPACSAGHRHRISHPRLVRPAVGADLGGVLRGGHAAARARREHLRLRMTMVHRASPVHFNRRRHSMRTRIAAITLSLLVSSAAFGQEDLSYAAISARHPTVESTTQTSRNCVPKASVSPA